MNRVATAEPPHADHAADESRTAHAIPLPDPLPTIPLGDEGIAWQGESRVVRELLAERSAAVEGTATVCQATTVKSGPHRAVYRVKLSSETFFLKHFKVADWRALARNAMLGSPADREAAAAAQIAKAGIETTVAAAVGTVPQRPRRPRKLSHHARDRERRSARPNYSRAALEHGTRGPPPRRVALPPQAGLRTGAADGSAASARLDARRPASGEPPDSNPRQR